MATLGEMLVEFGMIPQPKLTEEESNARELACLLHRNICPHSHIDYCGWQLATTSKGTDWNEYSRAKYLEMARNMLKVTDYVTASALVSMIQRG